MAWLLLRTEPAKEFHVVANLQGIFETYCPTEVRAYRHGLHRARAIKEIPLLPRLIFIYREHVSGLQDIIGHLYVLGVARDAHGGVLVVPDYQLALFREAVSEAILEDRRAYCLKLPISIGKKEIVKSFQDMAKVLNERSGLEKHLEAAE